MITGVIGVTLWTGDLERMFRFYHDTLRLPLHSRHEDFIAFELGGVRFNIGRHDRIQGPALDPYRIMPHFGVDDIHAEHRRLHEAGWSSSASRSGSNGAAGSPRSRTLTATFYSYYSCREGAAYPSGSTRVIPSTRSKSVS
ncbi:MAG: VOC family protein [Dehalococcoidia bacterium]|nr:VOC family protein [Dehalococcoidia bacterium]